MAAVRPPAHGEFFYVSHGHFSITLFTATSTTIAPSYILIVCPKDANGSISELHLGLSGARLTLAGGHYRFARAYTWKHPSHVIIIGTGAGTTTTLPSARVRVSGTVASPGLIKRTVSVTAPGCSLPSSAYHATTAGAPPA
jgi:hypothetical protein